ncbi:MAG: DUF885 family protein [Desulfobacterales bacterium]
MNPAHTQVALRYFNYLARRFPVMCASDEFYFLPRAQDAAGYYHQLDDLDAAAIDECINRLKKFCREFSRILASETNLERIIDLELLIANANGIVIELDQNRIWRHNPLLYLKIAFIGIDHAFNKPFGHPKERRQRIRERMSSIPRLMNQAVHNLDQVPASYYHAAKAMLRDGRQYLLQTSKALPAYKDDSLLAYLRDTIAALEGFGKYLDSIHPVSDEDFTPKSLIASLKDHFSSLRDLDEVFHIALDEWRENLERLKEIQSKLDPGTSWQNLYHGFFPDMEEMDTFSLYRLETERLRKFFSRHGFNKEELDSPLEIVPTPMYLNSVRSSASFAAAFSSDSREKSYFYITAHFNGKEKDLKENSLLKKRLHREYKFLTAHETIPGHHLLDSMRRRLSNPVRRQIESPLFYEGWAYYVETLLAQKGYIKDSLEHLVDYKRRLWRSARCQIDVGLPAGFITKQDAVELLTTVGFSGEEAVRQIHRFQLNPGYQLCYSLGRYEIMRLKNAYGNRMGDEAFHAFLLEGGELPFQWIEKRLQAVSKVSQK